MFLVTHFCTFSHFDQFWSIFDQLFCQLFKPRSNFWRSNQKVQLLTKWPTLANFWWLPDSLRNTQFWTVWTTFGPILVAPRQTLAKHRNAQITGCAHMLANTFHALSRTSQLRFWPHTPEPSNTQRLTKIQHNLRSNVTKVALAHTSVHESATQVHTHVAHIDQLFFHQTSRRRLCRNLLGESKFHSRGCHHTDLNRNKPLCASTGFDV